MRSSSCTEAHRQSDREAWTCEHVSAELLCYNHAGKLLLTLASCNEHTWHHSLWRAERETMTQLQETLNFSCLHVCWLMFLRLTNWKICWLWTRLFHLKWSVNRDFFLHVESLNLTGWRQTQKPVILLTCKIRSLQILHVEVFIVIYSTNTIGVAAHFGKQCSDYKQRKRWWSRTVNQMKQYFSWLKKRFSLYNMQQLQTSFSSRKASKDFDSKCYNSLNSLLTESQPGFKKD